MVPYRFVGAHSLVYGLIPFCIGDEKELAISPAPFFDKYYTSFTFRLRFEKETKMKCLAL